MYPTNNNMISLNELNEEEININLQQKNDNSKDKQSNFSKGSFSDMSSKLLNSKNVLPGFHSMISGLTRDESIYPTNEKNGDITEKEKDELQKFTECNICLCQAVNPLSCPQCQFLVCESCFNEFIKKHSGFEAKCPCCKKTVVANEFIKLPVIKQIQSILDNSNNKENILKGMDDIYKKSVEIIDESIFKYNELIKHYLDRQKQIKNYRSEMNAFLSSIKHEFDSRCNSIDKESSYKIDLANKQHLGLIDLKDKQSYYLNELNNKIKNYKNSNDNKKNNSEKELIKDQIENIVFLGKKLASSTSLSTSLSSLNLKNNTKSNKTLNFEEKPKFIEPSFNTFLTKKMKVPELNEEGEGKTRINLGPILKYASLKFLKYDENRLGNNEGEVITCRLRLDNAVSYKKFFFVSLGVCTDNIENKYHLNLDRLRTEFSNTISEKELFGVNKDKENSLIFFEVICFSIS